MFKIIAVATALLAGVTFVAPSSRAQDDYAAAVEKYVHANVMAWLNDKAVIDAIKAQNAAHETLSQADVEKLDKEWRAQVDGDDKPLINKTLGNELSKFLSEKKEASQGLITEIFVMDNKGLNVGQSDVTSDYWQGDEAKWQKTFQAGPDAIFVDEVEKDESTQQLQVQVSVSIKDPETGNAIGAVTLGISVDLLSS